jgi:hypothetical protein
VANTPSDAPTHAIGELLDALTARSIEFLRDEDFDRAQELTQIAREVQELRTRLGRILRSQTEPTASAVDSGNGRPELRKDYPHFHREDQTLVRTGLTRDRKTTYEQRCPFPVFAEIIRAVQVEVEIGQEFEASRIKGRVRCPDYQTYLVLGLLESLDYLDIPRRGVHRLQRTGGQRWAEEVWRQIPEGEGRSG